MEKAEVKDILKLPMASGNQPQKYINFTNGSCTTSSRSKPRGHLKKVNENVALTIDILPGIRGDLVRNDEDSLS